MKKLVLAAMAALALTACEKKAADESVVVDETATVTQNASEVVGEAVEAVATEAPAEK